MKKDIAFPKVEGVKIAITLQVDDQANEFWDVQIINRNTFAIENVMVNAGIVIKGGGKQKH